MILQLHLCVISVHKGNFYKAFFKRNLAIANLIVTYNLLASMQLNCENLKQEKERMNDKI